MKESIEGNYYVAVLRLEFDNSDYVSVFFYIYASKCWQWNVFTVTTNISNNSNYIAVVVK